MSRLSHRGRALLLVSAVLVAAVLVLAACGGGGNEGGGTSTSPSPSGDQPVAGGTYNFPNGAEPVYLDPLQGNYESEGTLIQHQVFQQLVRYDTQPDGSMKTVPSLA